MFNKAEKKKSRLRLALDGASGSGKTYSSLVIGSELSKKIAVIDTEHGSASLYSDKFDFDVMEIAPPYSPEAYIAGIAGAEKAGYEVLIIDSLSHEWDGSGGCLDIQNKLGGRYTDWAKVTPRHDALIMAILSSSMHIICTMRTKAEYVVEVNNRGKAIPTKVGTAPKQRDGMEYEFTTVFNINQQHMANVSKDRTGLFDGLNFIIDSSVGKSMIEWLENGKSEDGMVQEDKASLEVSKDMQGLGAAWGKIPNKFKENLNELKDAMKEKLTIPEDLAA